MPNIQGVELMHKIFLLILISAYSLSAQKLDSLYNLFLNVNNHTHELRNINDDLKPSKCSFGLMASIKENYQAFSIEQQKNINAIMVRTERHTSIVSPSGFFRIHFDTTGTNMPKYDNLNLTESVMQVAVAFDSAYNYEVNFLGFTQPPSDGLEGGDDLFDIYIVNFYRGTYGQTQWENKKSYIEIDNSFLASEGYYSHGIEAVQVTAAHEFHHAIQVGSYRDYVNSNDHFYFELTSTSMEEFVYDDVNDYRQYLNKYFDHTDLAFNALNIDNGYEKVLWNIFLKERFEEDNPMLGHEIIKKSWELLKNENNTAMLAIASAVQELSGFSFAQVFNEFATWLNFTNYNSKPSMYFEEGENFPLVRSTYKYEITNSKTISLQTNPTSINYITFWDYSNGFADTIVAVLSNSDFSGTTSNNTTEVQFTIANKLFEGSVPINENYFSKLSGQDAGFVQSSFIINNELAENQTPHNEVSFAYPQPFNYEKDISLYFPTFSDITNFAELNIYSPDMNLVYKDKIEISPNGNIVVKWNGLDNSKKKLASGVYIYVTKADGKIKKGKFVILN